MIEKKEENIRSESYFPDSNYYLEQENNQKKNYQFQTNEKHYWNWIFL